MRPKAGTKISQIVYCEAGWGVNHLGTVQKTLLRGGGSFWGRPRFHYSSGHIFWQSSEAAPRFSQILIIKNPTEIAQNIYKSVNKNNNVHICSGVPRFCQSSRGGGQRET